MCLTFLSWIPLCNLFYCTENVAPKLSAMKLATIRKSVLKSGSEWPLDKPPVVREVKYKGQKHLIDQKKRYALFQTHIYPSDLPLKVFSSHPSVHSFCFACCFPLA